MRESSTITTSALPLDLDSQVDAVCDEFEQQLKRGLTPDTEAFLGRLPPAAHRHLLREMAKLVREYANYTPRDHSAVPTPTESSREVHVGNMADAYLRRALELLPQIDDIGSEFERELERGRLPSIEERLAAVDGAARPRLLRELLKLEMDYLARTNELPSLENYRFRFPEHVRLVKYLYFEHFVPSRIGEFEIRKLVGRGGFGRVYHGWDERLSRDVAIKVFRRDPAENLRWEEGPLKEARAVAKLRHPGIVAVHAVLPDEDGDEFLVMEFVDGLSLEDLLRSRRLTAPEAVELISAIVEALRHLHDHGLIHRDLKPGNILLDHGNRPRITDFGLALHTADLRRSLDVAGTLPYMSPEQARGETHRLDERTDIWSVGVTLYRALTGWLPFSGSNKLELLDAIRYREPTPLVQHDPSMPVELVRIVQRCLAKSMGDRYQSASELADDLKAILLKLEGRKGSEANDRPSSPIAIVPRGLRCFEGEDREFFLRLVPGPRDRHGIPQPVRFWVRQLVCREPRDTFRVGLLYGPSGSGKSSLVRAAILPLLDRTVHTLTVEAQRGETATMLLSELQAKLKIGTSQPLADVIAELREGAWLPPGEKLVIVIDQFEQWLHSWSEPEGEELIAALRQCDGVRVQALLLVRDDFWMPARRLFTRLDIPLADGVNSLALDLFDREHARQVLTDFGVAFQRLPIDPKECSVEQTQFVDGAVRALAHDGRVVPVHLCLLAEMVKDRAWTPLTLGRLGGPSGLGAAFLEDMFDSRNASPLHRSHRKAARAVLERLLPARGSTLRGHSVPESDLRIASGYDDDDDAFSGLVRCLDQELRLITPADSSPQTASIATDFHDERQRRYQLTHDFLVTAIRNWLEGTRRQTAKGRAELRVIDYAESFAARPEPRQLPSLLEWCGMAVLTNRRRWNDSARKMMRAATLRHVIRAAVLLGMVTLMALIVYDRMTSARTAGLVAAVATSDSHDLPQAVTKLSEYSPWALPQLRERLDLDSSTPEEKVRLRLGLLALGEKQGDELIDRLLDSEVYLSASIAEILQRQGVLAAYYPQLRAIALNRTASRETRLRALAALTRLDLSQTGDLWGLIAADTTKLLLQDISENARHFEAWVEGFSPVKNALLSPLENLFTSATLRDHEQRIIAQILARYAQGDLHRVANLILDAKPIQFDVLAPVALQHTDMLRPILDGEVARDPTAEASEDERNRLARRKANAILMQSRMGNDRGLRSSLEHRPDPRIRSFLLAYLRTQPALRDWKDRLSKDNDSGVRQAMILGLASDAMAEQVLESPASVEKLLLNIFRDDPDPGVHAAADWALRRLQFHEQLSTAIAELSQAGIRDGFGWYVTKSKITMVIVQPPGDVLLGSPPGEPGRDASDEDQWMCRIDWPFAISATEVTQRQYMAVCPEYQHPRNENGPDLDCPVNRVTWFEAQTFCRRLGERDGVTEEEMTIPPESAGRKAPYDDCVKRTGYRLPTEAEWEVACRAGTSTSRFYGSAPELLSTYACFIDNSRGRSWRVGTGWPSPIGLFDMLGNASEWCQNLYSKRPDPHSIFKPGMASLVTLSGVSVRGNEYSSNGAALRAANRRFASANDVSSNARGFRLAHTIRPNNRPN